MLKYNSNNCMACLSFVTGQYHDIKSIFIDISKKHIILM